MQAPKDRSQKLENNGTESTEFKESYSKLKEALLDDSDDGTHDVFSTMTSLIDIHSLMDFLYHVGATVASSEMTKDLYVIFRAMSELAGEVPMLGSLVRVAFSLYDSYLENQDIEKDFAQFQLDLGVQTQRFVLVCKALQTASKGRTLSPEYHEAFRNLKRTLMVQLRI